MWIKLRKLKGHAGSLRAEGKTYAVLGCGCDICYPASSASLYRNIPAGHGGLISEYPPGTKPKPYFFPERNRLISALSDVVTVVEAREKSGSLITVDFALEQGKDIFAVPGRVGEPLSKGCNHLIYQGAGIISDIGTFLSDIGVSAPEKRSEKPSENLFLEKEERLVYSCLDLYPKSINQILYETGLPILDILDIMEKLTEKNLIFETTQNYYSRSINA